MLVVAINDDDSVQALEGRGPAGARRRASRRARGRAALRRLRRSSFPSRPSVRCSSAAPGRPLQGHRLHRGHRSRARHRHGLRRPHRHRRRSRRTIPRAICSRGSARSRRRTVTERAPTLLIVRLGSLGDVIHAIPAAAALRARYPERADRLAGRSALRRVLLKLVDGLDRVDPVRSARRSVGARLLRTIARAAARAVRRRDRSAGAAEVGGAGASGGRAADDRLSARAPARAAGARSSTPRRPIPGAAPHVIHKNLALMRRWASRIARSRFRSKLPRTVHAATRWPPVRIGAATP